jgi:hypothetical protein
MTDPEGAQAATPVRELGERVREKLCLPRRISRRAGAATWRAPPVAQTFGELLILSEIAKRTPAGGGQ